MGATDNREQYKNNSLCCWILYFSGLIGRGWAMLFTGGGYNVCLFDVENSQLTNAKDDIRQQFDKLEKSGLLKGKLSAKQQYDLIDVSTSLAECIKYAIHVQVSFTSYLYDKNQNISLTLTLVALSVRKCKKIAAPNQVVYITRF